jgi:hypothetical protein
MFWLKVALTLLMQQSAMIINSRQRALQTKMKCHVAPGLLANLKQTRNVKCSVPSQGNK